MKKLFCFLFVALITTMFCGNLNAADLTKKETSLVVCCDQAIDNNVIAPATMINDVGFAEQSNPYLLSVCNVAENVERFVLFRCKDSKYNFVYSAKQFIAINPKFCYS